MSEDPNDPGAGAASNARAGTWHWTTAIPDARPDWSALERAVRSTAPQHLFRWTHAHLLPDGTRVDEFVHRRSTALLFLGSDGRFWDYSGMGPGAIGPAILLATAAPGTLEHVLGLTRCDECLHTAWRERWQRGEPLDQPGDPVDPIDPDLRD